MDDCDRAARLSGSTGFSTLRTESVAPTALCSTVLGARLREQLGFVCRGAFGTQVMVTDQAPLGLLLVSVTWSRLSMRSARVQRGSGQEVFFSLSTWW